LGLGLPVRLENSGLGLTVTGLDTSLVVNVVASGMLLQSDSLRLRKVAQSATVSSTPSQTKLSAASVPATVQGFVIPMAAYLVAVLIVGVMVGKLLL